MSEGNFEKIQYPEIATELKAMRDADQEMRARSMENDGAILTEEDDQLDAKNTERMKGIIQQIGWPSVSKVGEEVAQCAWLLVQHADHDPEFQAQCLVMMKELPEGEVEPWTVAYLEDRVRVNTHRPQLYGTQFYDDPEKGYGPRPIEDVEHVEERRKALGLQPLEEYKKSLIEKYKASP